MNIALCAVSELWSPLQVWLHRLMPGKLSPLIGKRTSTCVSSIHSGQKPSRLVQRRPLRIVRILEAGQSSTQVGRMVISGRMADVCAELDRLASIDATPH